MFSSQQKTIETEANNIIEHKDFIYGILFGIAEGLVMTTTIVIWPNYFVRMHIGSVRGIATMGMVVSAGLGPLPFGALFDSTNSYDTAVLGFLALPIICCIAAIADKPPMLSLIHI